MSAVNGAETQARWSRLGDTAALGVAIGFIVALTLLPIAGVDLRYAYIPAAHGNLDGIYNPYWARPLFEMFALVPFQVAYAGWMVASLVALILSTWVFGGRLPFVLLTYQFGQLLYYGQIDALVVLGVAVSWLGVERRNPWLAGVGFAAASIKPQVSAPTLLLLWWWLDRPDKVRSLVIPLLVVLGSFWRYGWWVPGWLEQLFTENLIRTGSITLWEHTGPVALLLWIPSLFGRLPRRDKLLLFLATTALTMPYYQEDSLVILQVFPIGWMAWLGNLGFLFPILGSSILEWIVLLPLSVYGRYTWLGWRHVWLTRQQSDDREG